MSAGGAFPVFEVETCVRARLISSSPPPRSQQSTKSCDLGTNMDKKDNLCYRCVCANPECFQVQADLCQLTHDGGGDIRRMDDVWSKSPFQIHFDYTTASFKSWLFVLSLCCHLDGFKQHLVSETLEIGKVRLWINRIHFPRALLLNYSGRPTTLMTPADGRSMAAIDGASESLKESTLSIT